MSLLAHTSRVTFELSDRCNLSHAHAKCPAHAVRDDEPTFLEWPLIHRVLDFMREEGFTREIAWHNYNEPLTDPRLFYLLCSANVHVPDAHHYILTNGRMLNQEILDMLIAHNVQRVWVSAYSDAVEARCKALTPNVPIDYKVRRVKTLDHRLDIYKRKPGGDRRPCFEPLENLVIRADGRVGLCCVDWAQTVTYGDLHETTLREILDGGRIRDDWNRNRDGDRWHAICRRCRCTRGSKLGPPK